MSGNPAINVRPKPARYMTAAEFHRTGLLRAVNELVLWPFGLALAITYDTDLPEVDGHPAVNEEVGLRVLWNDEPIEQQPESLEEIQRDWWNYGEPWRDRVILFGRRQIGLMSPEDAAYATERLTKIGLLHGNPLTWKNPDA